MRLSNYVAQFLKEKGVDLVFAITGAGNIRLIEAVSQQGVAYICTHHEQAAIMASLTRWRTSGQAAVVLVTGGPGAANTITGVADAFLDSIPLIVLAGQERTAFMDPACRLRGKGIQGLDMTGVVGPITKGAVCVTEPQEIRCALEKAFHVAFSGRPGPVWLEIPQDVQWAEVNPAELAPFTPAAVTDAATCCETDMRSAAQRTLDLIEEAQRPLLWVGHGVRLAGAEASFRRMFDALGVPALASWQAADLAPDDHPLFVGRAGVYGQRFANLALQNCDLLITLGTRLAIPQRGYVDAEFAREARKVIVEIDPAELEKFRFEIDVPVLGDVGRFIACLAEELVQRGKGPFRFDSWLARCTNWRRKYPMAIPPTSNDGPINSYWFIDRLSDHLVSSDIIVTDMGTSLTCTHASIRLRSGQRLMTSTGLGEMGFGLPGAIGAALGAPDRRVVLICGEGSLMMNLQELQTLHHHALKIKIFLLNNNGYLTIAHTHKALFGNTPPAAVSPKSGVSFPDFSKVVPAFGIEFDRLATPADLDARLGTILGQPGCCFVEVLMSENQELAPKAALKVLEDGTMYSPPLEDLYPFLTPEELEREMIIPMLNR